MTPKERLAAILAYCDAATDGPWTLGSIDGGWDGVVEESNRRSTIFKLGLNNEHNAIFASLSRTDTPRLARACLRYRKALSDIRNVAERKCVITMTYEADEEVAAILEGKDECQSTIT